MASTKSSRKTSPSRAKACSRSQGRIAMSRSEPKAQLRIANAAPTLEIDLVDSNFAPVAAGVGGLEAAIEPGLYELSFREGTSERTQLLKVGAGEARTVEAPQFDPASPAPVEGTSTTHEYHQQPVLEATSELAAERSSSAS